MIQFPWPQDSVIFLTDNFRKKETGSKETKTLILFLPGEEEKVMNKTTVDYQIYGSIINSDSFTIALTKLK